MAIFEHIFFHNMYFRLLFNSIFVGISPTCQKAGWKVNWELFEIDGIVVFFELAPKIPGIQQLIGGGAQDLRGAACAAHGRGARHRLWDQEEDPRRGQAAARARQGAILIWRPQHFRIFWPPHPLYRTKFTQPPSFQLLFWGPPSPTHCTANII